MNTDWCAIPLNCVHHFYWEKNLWNQTSVFNFYFSSIITMCLSDISYIYSYYSRYKLVSFIYSKKRIILLFLCSFKWFITQQDLTIADFRTGRESSCLLGRFGTEIMMSDLVISAGPNGRESRHRERKNRKELNRPVVSAGDHMMQYHEFHCKAGETDKSFFGRNWSRPLSNQYAWSTLSWSVSK